MFSVIALKSLLDISGKFPAGNKCETQKSPGLLTEMSRAILVEVMEQPKP